MSYENLFDPKRIRRTLGGAIAIIGAGLALLIIALSMPYNQVSVIKIGISSGVAALGFLILSCSGEKWEGGWIALNATMVALFGCTSWFAFTHIPG